MAKGKKFDITKIQEHRDKKGMNQTDFWTRIGVTQSGGSRYEAGRNVPEPTAILLYLLETDQVTEDQIAGAKRAVLEKSRVRVRR